MDIVLRIRSGLAENMRRPVAGQFSRYTRMRAVVPIGMYAGHNMKRSSKQHGVGSSMR